MVTERAVTRLDQESITCRLQEVRSQAAHALAAPMTQAIALKAPSALGLFCASSHEPFHAHGRQESMVVTERSGKKPPQLPWSDSTVDQVVALAEAGRTWITAAPLRSAASAGAVPGCGPGRADPAARRAPARRVVDQNGATAAWGRLQMLRAIFPDVSGV
jgi:hypothetical protein